MSLISFRLNLLDSIKDVGQTVLFFIGKNFDNISFMIKKTLFWYVLFRDVDNNWEIPSEE
jgi:hypothetical protein